MLKAVGVDLKIREVDDVTDALGADTGWDLGISMHSALGMTGTDPARLLVDYYRSDGADNYGGISDAQLDALIDRIRQLPEADPRRNTLLEQAQQRIVTMQAFSWYLAYKRTPVVIRPGLAADYQVPVANLWPTSYS
ncbi:hypothetical protein [Cryptosporangium sp. NPDC048952]|uniref:hypothetical protein n=1 Tax=Cryptosporangium sp. NPDC048952 TaxID=3363961 RepID=UPI003716B5D7